MPRTKEAQKKRLERKHSNSRSTKKSRKHHYTPKKRRAY